MQCPKCGISQTSKNMRRHLIAHKLTKREIGEILAIMKSRKRGEEKATEGERVYQCPYCFKCVCALFTYLTCNLFVTYFFTKVKDFYSHRAKLHPDKKPVKSLTEKNQLLDDAIEISAINSLKNKYGIENDYINWTNVELPQLNDELIQLQSFFKAWLLRLNKANVNFILGWTTRHLRRVRNNYFCYFIKGTNILLNL